MTNDMIRSTLPADCSGFLFWTSTGGATLEGEGQEVFVQGDDATRMAHEFEAATIKLGLDDAAAAWLWTALGYGEAAPAAE